MRQTDGDREREFLPQGHQSQTTDVLLPHVVLFSETCQLTSRLADDSLFKEVRLPVTILAVDGAPLNPVTFNEQ